MIEGAHLRSLDGTRISHRVELLRLCDTDSALEGHRSRIREIGNVVKRQVCCSNSAAGARGTIALECVTHGIVIRPYNLGHGYVHGLASCQTKFLENQNAVKLR